MPNKHTTIRSIHLFLFLLLFAPFAGRCLPNHIGEMYLFTLANADVEHLGLKIAYSLNSVAMGKQVDYVERDTTEIDKELSQTKFRRGFSYMIATGLLIGSSNSNSANSGAWGSQATVVYKWHRWFQIGTSIGYDRYMTLQAVPFSIYYMANLTKNSGGFFAYSSIGISKMWSYDNGFLDNLNTEGGRVVQFGLGHVWQLSRVGLVLSAGFKRQKVENFSDYSWQSTTSDFVMSRSINRVEMKFGILF